MGKIALLFAGQGSQHPGMGKELVHAQPVAKQTFDELESAMPGLSKLCFEGTKEELTRTENTQPAIFATDKGTYRVSDGEGFWAAVRDAWTGVK